MKRNLFATLSLGARGSEPANALWKRNNDRSQVTDHRTQAKSRNQPFRLCLFRWHPRIPSRPQGLPVA
jgi:hypothetical protein